MLNIANLDTEDKISYIHPSQGAEDQKPIPQRQEYKKRQLKKKKTPRRKKRLQEEEDHRSSEKRDSRPALTVSLRTGGTGRPCSAALFRKLCRSVPVSFDSGITSELFRACVMPFVLGSGEPRETVFMKLLRRRFLLLSLLPLPFPLP